MSAGSERFAGGSTGRMGKGGPAIRSRKGNRPADDRRPATQVPPGYVTCIVAPRGGHSLVKQ